MRYKKIRGHKRIWKDIDDWIQFNKQLDIDYLKSNQRDYVKVWIRPFRNISVLNSEFSPPKGKTRQKIIAGLLEIQNHWKKQLEELNEPYYLRIWFYNDNVANSQVVCAIGDFLNFYETTFFKPQKQKPFPIDTMGLQWENRHQEIHVSELDFGEPDDFYSEKDYLDNKKWIEKIMNNPEVRITKHKENNGKETAYYSIKETDVWLGTAN